MNDLFFTVGPSKLFPTVGEHIAQALAEQIPSLSHRGLKFEKLFSETAASLRRLLSIPDGHRIFFVASGTEGMERIIQNCVIEKSFHFIDGMFSKKFHKTALAYGKTASVREARSLADFSTPLPKGTELVCFTHNETSTGMVIPPEIIHRIKRENPNTLVAVDAVSSMPHVALDYTLADCVFFSVQKGFGLPAGLGVMVISPVAFAKAVETASQGVSVGYHHSFAELDAYAVKNQTPETPNVLAIYLFGKVLADMEDVGIQAVREGVNDRSRLLYDYFLNHSNRFTIVQSEPELRSPTTVVAKVTGGSVPLIESLKKQGMIVGAGYGDDKEKSIRIANFPAHTAEDVERLLAALG